MGQLKPCPVLAGTLVGSGSPALPRDHTPETLLPNKATFTGSEGHLFRGPHSSHRFHGLTEVRPLSPGARVPETLCSGPPPPSEPCLGQVRQAAGSLWGVQTHASAWNLWDFGGSRSRTWGQRTSEAPGTGWTGLPSVLACPSGAGGPPGPSVTSVMLWCSPQVQMGPVTPLRALLAQGCWESPFPRACLPGVWGRTAEPSSHRAAPLGDCWPRLCSSHGSSHTVCRGCAACGPAGRGPPGQRPLPEQRDTLVCPRSSLAGAALTMATNGASPLSPGGQRPRAGLTGLTTRVGTVVLPEPQLHPDPPIHSWVVAKTSL